MKKLRLEELVVESYVTSAETDGRGTVKGNEAATEYFWDTCDVAYCPNATMYGVETCDPAWCPDYTVNQLTCAPTCDEMVCSRNVTCPWGYHTCNESCWGTCPAPCE